MLETKIDKMGRAVIPSEIRRILDTKEGDHIEWRIEGNKIIIKKKIVTDFIWIDFKVPVGNLFKNLMHFAFKNLP
jgi:AbrB family looped-hinge helix DNA binding protein